VSFIPKILANFVRDRPGSSEMSSWVLSIIAGVLTDFSFEWLFLVELAKSFLDISETKYLTATSYIVDLGYPKNRIISVCKRPTRRPLIIAALILRIRFYLLGHFIIMHVYYKHVTCSNINNDLPPKSSEARNSNLNLSGFWWRTLYTYIEKRREAYINLPLIIYIHINININIFE